MDDGAGPSVCKKLLLCIWHPIEIRDISHIRYIEISVYIDSSLMPSLSIAVLVHGSISGPPLNRMKQTAETSRSTTLNYFMPAKGEIDL